MHLLENGLDEDFRNQAEIKAKDIEISSISELRIMFHNPPKEPELYDTKQHGLGGWLSACQFAIFEVLFNFGEAALPLIREIAWGEYDWTQGNAIELLIRFAAKDIQRLVIINEIKSNYTNIRYEAQLYSIQPLLHRLDSDQALKLIFEELMEIDDFKESYDELTEESS